jgi:transposase-like protein
MEEVRLTPDVGEEGPSMTRCRHTPEQVIRKLHEGSRLRAEGRSAAEVAAVLEVSESSYRRWRRQYGGMTFVDFKRLKELKRENLRLKVIVADQALEIRALKEITEGSW